MDSQTIALVLHDSVANFVTVVEGSSNFWQLVVHSVKEIGFMGLLWVTDIGSNSSLVKH